MFTGLDVILFLSTTQLNQPANRNVFIRKRPVDSVTAGREFHATALLNRSSDEHRSQGTGTLRSASPIVVSPSVVSMLIAAMTWLFRTVNFAFLHRTRLNASQTPG
jgi:hypothetical protein